MSKDQPLSQSEVVKDEFQDPNESNIVAISPRSKQIQFTNKLTSPQNGHGGSRPPINKQLNAHGVPKLWISSAPGAPLAQKVTNQYETKIKKQPFNKDTIDTKRSFHINNVSVCLTEENNHVNVVNPVTLADTLWTDEYKLNKLMKE